MVNGAGVLETVARTAFGNRLGVRIEDTTEERLLFAPDIGSLLLEAESDMVFPSDTEVVKIGTVVDEPCIYYKDKKLSLEEALKAWESTSEPVFPTRKETFKRRIRNIPNCH